jgi:hypothetical protein
MIGRDVVIEAKIVEQLRWHRLHPHHRSAPPQNNTRMESRRPRPINRRLNQQYRRFLDVPRQRPFLIMWRTSAVAFGFMVTTYAVKIISKFQ